MAQMANITVFDGQVTPVSLTLVPVSTGFDQSGARVSTYRDTKVGVPVEAQIRVTITSNRMKNGVVRVSTRSEIPIVDSYTSVITHTDTFDTVSYSHPLSTAEGHRRVRMIGVNLANNISTSVVAATSGPVPSAHDDLILPV